MMLEVFAPFLYRVFGICDGVFVILAADRHIALDLLGHLALDRARLAHSASGQSNNEY